MKLVLFLALATLSSAQDVKKLADGEMLPIKLAPEDAREIQALNKQIEELEAKREAKKYDIRAKHGVPDDRSFSNAVTSGCIAPVDYEVEWRNDWMLVTKRVGANPCSFSIQNTRVLREPEQQTLTPIIGGDPYIPRPTDAVHVIPKTGSLSAPLYSTAEYSYPREGQCFKFTGGALVQVNCSEVK